VISDKQEVSLVLEATNSYTIQCHISNLYSSTDIIEGGNLTAWDWWNMQNVGNWWECVKILVRKTHVKASARRARRTRGHNRKWIGENVV